MRQRSFYIDEGSNFIVDEWASLLKTSLRVCNAIGYWGIIIVIIKWDLKIELIKLHNILDTKLILKILFSSDIPCASNLFFKINIICEPMLMYIKPVAKYAPEDISIWTTRLNNI